jgi:hypothetical protein
MFIRIIFITGCFLSSAIYADSTLSEKAEQVLNVVKYQLPAPSIIGEREWKELQLDRLVTMLDRTKTSFGRWGLVQLLHPIADEQELQYRKKIITFLLENESVLKSFQKQLEHIHDVEKSLLSYWDEEDRLDYEVQQFYYSFLDFKKLNKSSLALDVSTLLEMFYAWRSFIGVLALGGLSAEFTRWLHSPEEDIDLWGGLKAGLAVPIVQHSPYRSLLKDPYDPNTNYTYKDWVKAFSAQGSWGDRFAVLTKGYKYTLFSTDRFSSGSNKIGAFIIATMPTLFSDYEWITSINYAGNRLLFIYRTLNKLQSRISDVARCIKTIKNFRSSVVKQMPELGVYFEEGYDPRQENLVEKLLTERFLKKPGLLYSRGHVLNMHLDIIKNKKSLIPLLHSIALLDGYCSIVQLYKESKNNDVSFCFPEFIDSAKPCLNYSGAWLPLLSGQAIVNDLRLGCNMPGKIIITGPNGGGKSTILKTYGVAVVLAQSWMLAPASSAQQTLFSSIRTSLAPHEDLAEGLSTFMAEKKAMTELLDDIRATGADNKMLVLIDEPYKGTVDAESANRIYQFGKDVAGFAQVLLALATHVKKPIFLERDTAGIFSNYQIVISETRAGVFKRLFKLEPGPAMWWFDDEDKRSRFVDWISTGENSQG